MATNPAGGKSKVQLDPFLPEKEEDLVLRQRLLNDIHASFKGVVLDARGEKLKIGEDRAFSGEVFTGREGPGRIVLLSCHSTLPGVILVTSDGG